MWILGFWQDFRDASMAVQSIAQACFAVDSMSAKKHKERAEELEEENEQLKAQLKSAKRKKKPVKKRK